MFTADEVIAALGLRPLPVEGGYYRETYRAALRLPAGALGPHYADARAASTAIYYLLTPDTFSALHRLPGDEVYHFYLGDPVEVLQLGPAPADGGRVLTLGTDLRAGQAPQAVVPGGVWQGSALASGGRFALLGTTMAPGFEFADYEAGDRAALLATYPAFADRVRRLTR
jgi:uncharacterized protein